MGKTYAGPSEFKTALKQAAKNMSQQYGTGVAELMNIFYFNRLAARVFTADPEGWLIKGGQALLVRYESAARLSKDIDLQCTAPERTSEEAAALLIEAARQDLGGDFLRFAPTKFVPASEEGRGGAQYFQVFLGGPVATIKVDLVVGRTLSGVAETRRLKSAVDLEWPVDWPDVRLYPVIDHVADKICAMYERHPRGGSNRYRDLADLLLITQQERISGQQAHQALHREAARRRAAGIELTLPPVFHAPGPDWERNYASAAALVLGLVGCRTFPEASKAVEVFVNPLFDGSVHGVWQPDWANWG